jgi:hypothetical protein
LSHPSKRKGTAWESAVARWCGAKRLGAINGQNDQGDIHDGDWVVECKNEARITLSDYIDQLNGELARSGKPLGVVFVKRRGYASPACAYALMSGFAWLRLRNYVRQLEQSLDAVAPVVVDAIRKDCFE